MPVIVYTGFFVFVTIAPVVTDARLPGLALMVPVVLSIPVGLSLAAVGVVMRAVALKGAGTLRQGSKG